MKYSIEQYNALESLLYITEVWYKNSCTLKDSIYRYGLYKNADHLPERISRLNLIISNPFHIRVNSSVDTDPAFERHRGVRSITRLMDGTG